MVFRKPYRWLLPALLLIAVVALSACNLGAPAQEEAIETTQEPTDTPSFGATRTVLPDIALPTTDTSSVTSIPFPTSIPLPTRVVILPPTNSPAIIPTNTPSPISIVILSPIPGNVAAGNIQILGSASHPNFLQYRLEYGPQNNPSNLWFPITGIVQSPVLNGVLGIWNTNLPSSPDGLYQLRLRVFLRDGQQLTTVVNNIRVQNQAPTPVPSNTPNIPRPIAAFNVDRVSGEAPLVVRFTNQSQGQITTTSWNFGDNSTSTVQNPVHTFQNPGLYLVTLRVSGPGGEANVSRQISVRNASAPIAKFTPSTLSGTSPLTVTFDNQSEGNFTSVNWDFGDGSESTELDPTHTFTAVGSYNVILEVTGPGGTTSAVRQISVENPQVPRPEAAFTTTIQGDYVPVDVAFENQTVGDVTQYLWDFNGDGVTDSTDAEPVHRYEQAGTYNVRLIAIGPGGQTTTTSAITLNAPPDAPEAGFTANPESGDFPLEVQFTNTTNTNGNPTTYAWDFNDDGTTDSTTENPTFTFQSAGTYKVTLTATGDGGSTSAEMDITVTTPIEPPSAAFTPDKTEGLAPLTVTFLNESDGTEVTYEWDFDGDGTVDSNDVEPSFTYNTPGTYDVTLRVANSEGQDSAQTTITVTQPQAPTTSFTVEPQTGPAPLTVTLTNTTDPNTFTSFGWDLNNDGQPDNTTDSQFQFTFQEAGEYPITLTTDNNGASDSETITVSVTQPQPQAPTTSFTVEPQTGPAPLTITLTNTTDPNTFTSFGWDLNNDGQPDNTTDSQFQFTFQEAGEYPITLTTDNNGASDSETITVSVTQPQPEPVTGDLAYIENGDIIIANSDGTNPVNVTQSGSAESDVVWSPDGTRIAYVSNQSGNRQIFVTNLSDRSTVQLTSEGENINPDWSPDGNRIAFTSNRFGDFDIFIMNADGSNQLQLTTDTTQDISPTWANDNSRIAFVSNAGETGDNNIYVLNVNDAQGGLVQLTTEASDDIQPEWSSNGNFIVFASDRGDNGDYNIWVMNADGTNVVQLTTDSNSDTQPTLISDGSQIAFISNRINSTDNLFVMNADGSNQTQISQNGNVTQPDWR